MRGWPIPPSFGGMGFFVTSSRRSSPAPRARYKKAQPAAAAWESVKQLPESPGDGTTASRPVIAAEVVFN